MNAPVLDRPLGSPWIWGLTHAPQWHEKLTIVLQAYLDASGQVSDPCVVVAGYVGNGESWKLFDARWGAFLASHPDMTRFHAAKYCARRERPFSRWSNAEYDRVPVELKAVFADIGLVGQGCALSVNAFQDWRSAQKHFVLDDPYYFCLDHVLEKLIRGVVQHPRDEGIVIYCDREKNHEQLGEKIAAWHTQKLRMGEDIMRGTDKDRTVSTTYASSFDNRGLQAADIVAHGLFQRAGYLLRGNPRPPRPDGWGAISPLLSAVETSPFGVQFLDSKEMRSYYERATR